MFGSNGSSWSSRWDTARDFLDNNVARTNRGVFFNNVDNYADDSLTSPTSGSVAPGAGGCSASTDCASGWRCVNGECVPPQNTPGDPSGGGNDFGCGGGGGGGGGEGGFTPGGGGGQCAGGTGQVANVDALTDSGPRGGIYPGGCANSSPGGNGCGGEGYDGGPGAGYPEATTGCSNPPNSAGACAGGRRCCRFRSRVNAVHCNCGDCGQNDVDCQKFCADHASATGESAGGCKKEVECDECTTCEWVGFSGTSDIHRCEPKDGGPCWCNNGSDCRECQTCLESGSCGYTAESQRACLPPPPPDPVEPPETPDGECSTKCKYRNRCGSSESGTPAPSCGPGEKFVGRIETESGVCVICEYDCKPEGDCDPEPCDCNCSDDCPECYICNGTSGECEEDPECAGKFAGARYTYQSCINPSEPPLCTISYRVYCDPAKGGCPSPVGQGYTPCQAPGPVSIYVDWQFPNGEQYRQNLISGFSNGFFNVNINPGYWPKLQVGPCSSASAEG